MVGLLWPGLAKCALQAGPLLNVLTRGAGLQVKDASLLRLARLLAMEYNAQVAGGAGRGGTLVHKGSSNVSSYRHHPHPAPMSHCQLQLQTGSGSSWC